MKYLRKLLEAYKEKHRTLSAYFSDDRENIASENLSVMKIGTLVGFFVTLFFIFITPYIITSWHVTIEYYFLPPLMLGFFIFTEAVSKSGKKPNPTMVEWACALFFVLLFAVFVTLSTIENIDAPQIWVTLFLMLMPAFLIQRPWINISIAVVASVLCIVFSNICKLPRAAEQDTFNVIAAFIVSLIVMAITNKMRVRAFLLRIQYRALSMTDQLTGILNKTSFENTAGTRLATRDLAKDCAFVALDLDEFKRTNDTYGHQAGDLILKEMGRLLRKYFRQTDLIGRVGGDEFCVLLTDRPPQDSFRRRIEALQEELRSYVCEDIREMSVTCSVGVVLISGGESVDYDMAYKKADDALYEAKNAGRDTYCIKSM